MAEYTKNFNLIKPSQEDFYNVDDFNDNFEKIDQMAVKKGNGIAELIGGTLANRPAPEIIGRYYFAQDTGEIFLDTGTEWVLAAASRTDFASHLADEMPHQFTSTNKTYRYGFKAQDNHLIFTYEEVV